VSNEHLEKEFAEEDQTFEAIEEIEATADDPEVVLTIEEQLAKALAEAEDYKDRWMRGQAEFANARKRMEKQRTETYTNAKADVVLKVLPALDDFERAIENTPAPIREDSWYEGIQLVERKFKTLLEGLHITPIETVGVSFDPNFHEAISQEPTDEFESGIICRELQKGYQIGDRVIRPALVIVAQ
jgi:molecular chaperone GrpE